MSMASIVIHGCVQDVQERGVPDDQVISKIYFDLIVGDRKYERCIVRLTQPVGTDYASAPIEVGPPEGYDGSWNQKAFAAQAEHYYRTQVCGTATSGLFNVQAGKNLRIRNNTRMFTHTFDLELPD